jgi:hypothetical protein
MLLRYQISFTFYQVYCVWKNCIYFFQISSWKLHLILSRMILYNILMSMHRSVRGQDNEQSLFFIASEQVNLEGFATTPSARGAGRTRPGASAPSRSRWRCTGGWARGAASRVWGGIWWRRWLSGCESMQHCRFS